MHLIETVVDLSGLYQTMLIEEEGLFKDTGRFPFLRKKKKALCNKRCSRRGVPNLSFRRLFEKETVTMLSSGGLMNGCVRSSVCFHGVWFNPG